jgi:hypothetical protein
VTIEEISYLRGGELLPPVPLSVHLVGNPCLLGSHPPVHPVRRLPQYSSSSAASSLSARVGSRRIATLMSSFLAAAHGTTLSFGLSSSSPSSSTCAGGGGGSSRRWKATGAAALRLGTGLGGSEGSRERTRLMIPSTAWRVRPPAVRGLALVGGPAFLGGGCLGLWRLGFGGPTSAEFGGSWFCYVGPWSHGGGGGFFVDGEKRGRAATPGVDIGLIGH